MPNSPIPTYPTPLLIINVSTNIILHHESRWIHTLLRSVAAKIQELNPDILPLLQLLLAARIFMMAATLSTVPAL